MCCRQLVPIAPAEIGYLQRVLRGLPDERQGEILAACRSAGEELRRVAPVSADRLCSLGSTDRVEFGRSWFALGIACPFLVDERCSIHPQRPLACREYVVNSPPDACATPGSGNIRRLAVPVSLWSRVARDTEGRPSWLPLIEALDADPPAEPAGSASEVITALLNGGRRQPSNAISAAP